VRGFGFEITPTTSDLTTKPPDLPSRGGRRGAGAGQTLREKPVVTPLQIKSISFNTKIQKVFSHNKKRKKNQRKTGKKNSHNLKFLSTARFVV